MDEQVIKALGLRLPKQNGKEPTVGSTQPRRLKRWLDDLPPMNVWENARQLFRYLHELNRYDMRSKHRFELLETVRPHVFKISATLEKDYWGQNLVLPERPRQAASLAQALQTYLADGYLLLLQRALKNGDAALIKKVVPTFIHRAMVSLRDTLFRTQLLYFRPPRYLWLMLHQQFVLAEFHKLLTQRVEDKVVPEASATLEEMYKRILLLGALGANQLRQNELKRVLPLVDQLAPLAELSVRLPSKYFFYVNLIADRAPASHKLVEDTRGRFRYLLTADVVAALSSAELKADVPEALLEHMRHHLGGNRERSVRRQPKKLPLEVCFGLSASHYYLSDGADFSSLRSAHEVAHLVGEETNRFLRGPETPKVHDEWSVDFSTSEGLGDFDISGLTQAMSDYARQQRGEDYTPPYKKYVFETMDVSAGGYGVACEAQPPECLKTGELVGMRENGRGDWIIGVVRWVRQQSQGGASFGIEFLASQAWPAAVRKHSTTEADFVRAIVLPEFITLGLEASLLLPSLGFAQGDAVEVVHQGVTENLTLKRSLLRATGFNRYEVVPTTKTPPSTQEQGSPKPPTERDLLDTIF